MNIPTITMDRAEARRAFLEYRSAVREALDREITLVDDRRAAAVAERRESDEALMRGYRQLSLGYQVIDLRRVLSEGGQDEQGRPRLAVARADEQQVHMDRARDGAVTFSVRWTRQRSDHRDPRTQRSLAFPAGTLPVLQSPTLVSADAVVPTIPPRLRPAQLDRYHLLWEAEWRRVAPVDPALLRALGDGLYVVVATWDLTELERAVLGIRAS